MGFFKWIDDVRALWWYVSEGQFGALGEPTMEQKISKHVREPQDKISSNLYVGKIIEDSILKCEVMEIHNTNIHVKILDIYWPRMGTYLDVGTVYPVFKHSGWNDESIQVWKIAPKHMKRSTSQVIFQWEDQVGWCWDLDM